MHTRFYFALLTILIISGFCPSFTTAQAAGPIAEQVEQQAEEYANMPATSLFAAQAPPADLRRQAQKEIQQATYLQSSPMGVQQLLRQRPERLKLALPLSNGSQLTLRLYQSQPLSEDFVLRSSSRTEGEPVLGNDLHYWGIVEGDINSLTAISISPQEVMGFIHTDGLAYSLGRLDSERANWHILYEEGELTNPPSAVCEYDPAIHEIKSGKTDEQRMSPNPDNCVRMYVEADHSIFQDKGSVSATTSYVSGVFNQVSILFANDNMNVVVNEIFVWSSPDPYT
ncbi:MAG TPA: hypothetical protein VJ933_12945, partial [Phaeodactylibacter sp.]|nr:hypothetical protein [Phaeodactylibacter sp.]